jgi:hypothetical protein
MANTDIQSIAIQKTATMLDAMGVAFYIKHGDTEYGNVKPMPAKQPTKRAPRQPLALYYHDAAAKLKVGQSHKWTFDNAILAASVRSAVTAYASKHWGKQSYVSTLQTESDGGASVEILRMA